ncbi:MAG TPA: hypothetical protein VFM90_12900 [Cyclobacteriaceae bacterium]|nr:hypothetical protein [Cyclobacteriaceae bacterium]
MEHQKRINELFKEFAQANTAKNPYTYITPGLIDIKQTAHQKIIITAFWDNRQYPEQLKPWLQQFS